MSKKSLAYPVLLNDVLSDSYKTSLHAYYHVLELIPAVDAEKIHSLSQVRRIINKTGCYEYRTSNHLSVKIQQLLLK